MAVLIGVVSAKGSPGATTAGLGLATRWPVGPGVLVEADPAGGDLAARFGLAQGPGLAAMAVAARHSDQPPDPASWTRALPVGVHVVPAAPGGAAAAALSSLAGHGLPLLKVLAGAYPVVVVDAGRWAPGSPADELLSHCEVVLLVARPVLEQIRQGEALVGPLGRVAGDVRLLLVEQRGGWPAAEVGTALGLPVAGVLPDDGQGAGVLAGRLVPRHGWRTRGWSSWSRLPLPRACRSVACALLPPPVTVSAKAGEARAPAAQGPGSGQTKDAATTNKSSPQWPKRKLGDLAQVTDSPAVQPTSERAV
jgi:hypothetical protein